MGIQNVRVQSGQYDVYTQVPTVCVWSNRMGILIGSCISFDITKARIINRNEFLQKYFENKKKTMS